MGTNKISVIVPVYNGEKFVAFCLDSIMRQTYRDLEIIVVNDGSLDSSLRICRNYALNDNRIIVVDKENGGVASARNSGIDIATGDYLGFIDCDDYISEEMFEKLLEALLENDCDIAECGYNQVDEEHRVFYESKFQPLIISGSYDCSYNFVTEFSTSQFVCNKLFRRFLFDQIRFPKLTSSEDYIVNIETTYLCRKKVVIIGRYYNYYKHGNSTTNREFQTSRLDTIKAGKQGFAFHQERYKDLCQYIAVYICNYVLFCYYYIKKSNLNNKREYIRAILKDFRIYYPLITKEAYKVAKFGVKQKHFFLFSLCAPFYNFLLRNLSK